MKILLALCSLVFLPQSVFALTLVCQYQLLNSAEFGKIYLDMDNETLTMAADENSVLMENSKTVVCGMDQTTLKDKTCFTKRVAEDLDIFWATTCTRHEGLDMWKKLSSSDVRIDWRTRSGFYRCESVLSNSQRTYELSHCSN